MLVAHSLSHVRSPNKELWFLGECTKASLLPPSEFALQCNLSVNFYPVLAP